MFYYFLAGIGLLFAGIGGLKVFLSWNADVRERKKIEKNTLELRAEYSLKDLGDSFKLIKGNKDLRKVFLFDIDADEKRWIDSPSTLRALEFDFYMVEIWEQKKVDSIKEGKKISIYE